MNIWIIVAVISVILILLIAFFTLGQSYVVHTGRMWDSNVNPYVCPQSLVGGFCILPEEEARVRCSADPGCTGYLVANGWSGDLKPSVRYGQLLNKPPIPVTNLTQDVLYYSKK